MMLSRIQAERRTREADSGATDRAALTEYCAIGLMAEALGVSKRTVEGDWTMARAWLRKELAQAA